MKINLNLKGISEVPLKTEHFEKGLKVILRRRGCFEPWPNTDFTLETHLTEGREYTLKHSGYFYNYPYIILEEGSCEFAIPIDHFNVSLKTKTKK